MPSRVRLDHAGLAEVLKSGALRSAVSAVADSVAAGATAHPSIVKHGMPIQVRDYVTDRVASSVTIAHAGGMPVEAKHGVLTAAAGAEGLEVGGSAGADLVEYTTRKGETKTVSRAQAAAWAARRTS